MKVGFRQLCLLSLKNVSSFSVLGVLLGRFSSVLQCIWISEIPARAGALQLWREPSREVTCLAARSSKNNLSNSTQEAKKEEARSTLGCASRKVRPRLRAWEWAEKGGHQRRGRTGKEMEKLNFWCGHEKTLGEGHMGCEEVHAREGFTLPPCLILHWNQKTRMLARDGDAHPRELLL